MNGIFSVIVAYAMTAPTHVPGEWHEISSDPELLTAKASEATGHSVQIHPYSAILRCAPPPAQWSG